jgi:hypothetical protein
MKYDKKEWCQIIWRVFRMKQRLADFLIIFMCGGMLGCFAANLQDWDITQFHPDFSFQIFLWLFCCGLIAWGLLTLWFIGNLIAGRFGISDPSLQKKLMKGWLIGLLIFLIGGMLMPSLTRRTHNHFARECGSFLGSQVEFGQTTLEGGKYPDLTMKEIYLQWLKYLPEQQHSMWTPDNWRKHLEFYLTTHTYRRRKDLERMPAENDFVYIYCGQGVSREDHDTIIFYEKPDMHRLGGNVRNVIYADGRYRAVFPDDWPRIDSQIKRQMKQESTER